MRDRFVDRGPVVEVLRTPGSLGFWPGSPHVGAVRLPKAGRSELIRAVVAAELERMLGDEDDDPIGELDDDTLVLLQAMSEMDDELARSFDPAKHQRYPKGHPLGGKFRPMVDLLKQAIADHKPGDKQHPFEKFTRPQLVNAAKARGIPLKRGEDRDSIAAKLLADLTSGRPDTKPSAAKEPVKAPIKSEGATGTNLLAKSNVDKLAQQIDTKARMKATGSANPGDLSGPNGDERLWAIRDKQGFNGKPRIVTKEELDGLIEEGHIELFRGFRDHEGKTAEHYADQLRHGPNFAGYGVYGNGTYTTDMRAKAASNASRETAIVRMAISPSAKLITYQTLERMRAQFLEAHAPDSVAAAVWGDPGRFATALGFDVIVSPASRGTEYVILNRTALYIEAAT